MTLIDYTLLGQSPIRLWIEKESAQHYIVQDLSQNSLVMYRCPDLDSCERWMRRFVELTPGARIDEDSLAVCRGAALHRNTLARALASSGGAAGTGPTPPGTSNVIPLNRRSASA